jgi:phage tail-like protein
MPFDVPPKQVSSYLEQLPATFQQNADESGVTFIGRFLLAFEKILSGLGDPAEPGLEERLHGIVDPSNGSVLMAGLQRYFDPGVRGDDTLPETQRAPDEFLPWLASWVALTLREDWTPAEKRRLISRIVSLYHKRGTKEGLSEILSTYTGGNVNIYEFEQPAHYFQVELLSKDRDPAVISRKEQIARAIINQEKPAHTFYTLKTRLTVTMQIGVASTIGDNTLIGS